MAFAHRGEQDAQAHQRGQGRDRLRRHPHRPARDGIEHPDRDLLQACECDARGRSGLEAKPYPQAAYLARALEAAAAVELSPPERAGLSGKQIGEKLRALRLAAVIASKNER